ncbi:MAG: hypothetical protein M1834_003506 [Cirrosporium novae-zelandiae]|nr:MAG: hypothetical protein M1834_003506 [Cirrosporium novae-zelandiae]
MTLTLNPLLLSIVVTGSILLVCLGLVMYIWYSRRRRKCQQEDIDLERSNGIERPQEAGCIEQRAAITRKPQAAQHMSPVTASSWYSQPSQRYSIDMKSWQSGRKMEAHLKQPSLRSMMEGYGPGDKIKTKPPPTFLGANHAGFTWCGEPESTWPAGIIDARAVMVAKPDRIHEPLAPKVLLPEINRGLDLADTANIRDDWGGLLGPSISEMIVEHSRSHNESEKYPNTIHHKKDQLSHSLRPLSAFSPWAPKASDDSRGINISNHALLSSDMREKDIDNNGPSEGTWFHSSRNRTGPMKSLCNLVDRFEREIGGSSGFILDRDRPIHTDREQHRRGARNRQPRNSIMELTPEEYRSPFLEHQKQFLIHPMSKATRRVVSEPIDHRGLKPKPLRVRNTSSPIPRGITMLPYSLPTTVNEQVPGDEDRSEKPDIHSLPYPKDVYLFPNESSEKIPSGRPSSTTLPSDYILPATRYEPPPRNRHPKLLPPLKLVTRETAARNMVMKLRERTDARKMMAETGRRYVKGNKEEGELGMVVGMGGWI